MILPRTYYLSIISAATLAAYLLGFFMFYSASYGLPEYWGRIAPIFFIPQMFGFFIFIPLAIVQFVLAFINSKKPGINVAHYIYSGVGAIICQFIYWAFMTNGFVITN